MKKVKLVLSISITASLLLLFLTHCSEEDEEVQDVFISGESAKLGVGEVNAWASAFFSLVGIQ